MLWEERPSCLHAHRRIRTQAYAHTHTHAPMLTHNKVQKRGAPGGHVVHTACRPPLNFPLAHTALPELPTVLGQLNPGGQSEHVTAAALLNVPTGHAMTASPSGQAEPGAHEAQTPAAVSYVPGRQREFAEPFTDAHAVPKSQFVHARAWPAEY